MVTKNKLSYLVFVFILLVLTLSSGLADVPNNVTKTAYVNGSISDVVVAFPGLLLEGCNPIDLSGTVSNTSSTLHGDLTFPGDGSFTYSPFLDFSGVDYFKFTCDNVSEAFVILGINNTAPIATEDRYNTSDGNLNVNNSAGILFNDTNVENDTIYISNSTINNGNLTLNSDGSFNFTAGKSNGVAYFNYSISDLQYQSSTVDVVFIIGNNTAPVANADRYYTDLNTTLIINATGILGNDTDTENDDLFIYLINSTTNGSLTLFENGSFEYVPNETFVGVDNFTYLISDRDLNSSQVNVSIYVNVSFPVAPVITTTTTTSGGGGGGGSGGNVNDCPPEYSCTDWSVACINGTQTRVCTKTTSTCYINQDLPNTERSCLSLNNQTGNVASGNASQNFFGLGNVIGGSGAKVFWPILVILIALGAAWWIVKARAAKSNGKKSKKK